MPDDTALLDQLEKALRSGAVEPPAERVHAVRHLVTGRRTSLRAISGGDESPVVSPPVPTPRWAWADRRLTMVFSGAAAAALLVIAAVAALQVIPGSQPDRSTALLRAQNAAYQVQEAIDQNDPARVAKADAELLRTGERVSGPERSEAQRITVPAHVKAIAFLRDHASPNVLSDVPGAVSSAAPSSARPPDPGVPPGVSLPELTVPGGLPKSVGPIPIPPLVDAPTTTTVAVPTAPKVMITGVYPRLDGNFEVNFSVSGFTPDASGAAGTYAVRFSYGNGADATTYTGESPWSLPLVKAILHRQICAEVVDSSGAVVPDSGTCTNIINL